MPPTTQPEHERSTGALPTGATSEQAAAANVQQMFDTIAPTYDRANHTLSAGIDRYWWTRTARTFRTTLARPEANVLDLCCGTGDMTLALYKHRPKPNPKNIVSTKNIVILERSEGSAVKSGATESPGAPSMTVPSSWVGYSRSEPHSSNA